jgi:hypothetical protein
MTGFLYAAQNNRHGEEPPQAASRTTLSVDAAKPG